MIKEIHRQNFINVTGGACSFNRCKCYCKCNVPPLDTCRIGEGNIQQSGAIVSTGRWMLSNSCGTYCESSDWGSGGWVGDKCEDLFGGNCCAEEVVEK